MAGKQERLVIFDTTLRDGEQSPGASMNLAQKLEVARALDLLGVDVIEAGFPITSPDDFEAVQTIGREVTRPTICGLARCVEKDIVAAGQALKTARRGRIHVFLATSAIHRKFKLHKAQSEIVKMTIAGVKAARQWTDDVQFSPEDAARTEPDFLAEVVEAVIDAGASTVNIPDTVGYTLPWRFDELIGGLFRDVGNIGKAVIAIHCHNDLGLAVANSLSAVRQGARQIECTINGIGERAGNCSLEEVVMAIKTRCDEFPNVSCGIATRRLYPTSRLVSRITGLAVQRNKAIVGENAFAHEAGIHQDGILKERTTYEIMRPEDVGFKQSSLVLGKHSGRHALAERMKQLGFKLTAPQLDQLFERFKVLADRKKEIFDEDLEALAETELSSSHEFWRLGSLHVSSGTSSIPTATLELVNEKGETSRDASTGDGPVDAIFRAVERLTGVTMRLEDYQIRAVTGGKEAQGEVRVGVRYRSFVLSGRGISTDVLEASARAYIDATNRALARQSRGKAARKPAAAKAARKKTK
ncbi:MAG: 2-isopropylmalate synthase [Phycisphaerae bacterium]|nr:2-isopropylmalate synthase [Phycisphaerae bacterium]